MHRLLRGVLLVVSVGLLLPAASATPHPIQFAARQMGITVTGGFARLSATALQVDPAHLAATKGTVNVDANSIDLDAGDYADSLKEADWLDTAHFPQASFTLDALSPKGGNAWEARGSLTIKGVRRPLAIALEIAPDGAGVLHAHGSFSIQRLDYKLGTGDWADTKTLENEVKISVDVPLRATPARH